MDLLMNVMIFFGVCILICVLIAFLPVGVLVKYSPEGFEFHFTLWKKSFVLYPVVELKKEKKPPKKQKAKKKTPTKSTKSTKNPETPPKAEKPLEETASEKKEEADELPEEKVEGPVVTENIRLSTKKPKEKGIPKGKSPKKPVGLEDKMELAKAFLPLILLGFQRLGQYKKIDQLELDLVVGSSDPVEATLLYGKAHALLGTLWLPLDHGLNIQKGRAGVRLEFEEVQPSIYAVLAVSLTIGQIVYLLASIGLGSYRILGKK